MALKITNLDTLKTKEAIIQDAKSSYDETMKKLKEAIMSTEESWNDKDGYDFREKLISLIESDLKTVSEEMEFEINYIKKVTSVLENTQQQVQSRLNG